MGNVSDKRDKIFNPGAVLDRLIAMASPEDKCLLYKLNNFKKSGQLVEAFNSGGSKEVMGDFRGFVFGHILGNLCVLGSEVDDVSILCFDV
jgi:hypothetical protein